MSQSISRVCEQLVEISEQFEENEELVEAIVGNDNAEDLLVAIGMAIAFTENVLTVSGNGMVAHMQPFCNLTIGSAYLNFFDDLHFAFGKRVFKDIGYFALNKVLINVVRAN